MEESQVIAERNRGSTVAKAVSQSMMHMSILEREELRIFRGVDFGVRFAH